MRGVRMGRGGERGMEIYRMKKNEWGEFAFLWLRKRRLWGGLWGRENGKWVHSSDENTESKFEARRGQPTGALDATSVYLLTYMVTSAKRYCDRSCLWVGWLLSYFVSFSTVGLVKVISRKVEVDFREIWHGCSAFATNVTIMLTFERSRSKFKVKTAVL